jgi:hypothetical protein
MVRGCGHVLARFARDLLDGPFALGEEVDYLGAATASQRRGDRGECVKERGLGVPIAHTFKLSLECMNVNSVVSLCERVRVSLGAERVEEPRRALDVSEQEGDRAGREVACHRLDACSAYGTETVTRRNVAGIDVTSGSGLVFCSLNRASSSFCRSAARPLASAASKAFMVGP